MSFILGITGGVGAGKSTVLDYLEKAYGALLIKCDEVDNELKEPGGAVYEEIIGLLGREIVMEDGRLDKKMIAGIVFEKHDLLEKLTSIIHPAVKKRVLEIIRDNEERSLITIEAALLLDDNYGEICDEIWYIYAPEGVRRQRLKESRGYSDERIDAVYSSQRSEESFRSLVDLIIDNSTGNPSVSQRQVDEAMKKRKIKKI